MKYIDKQKFLTSLQAALPRFPTESDVPTPAAIDESVRVLVKILGDSERRRRLPRPPFTPPGRMPWWNEELESLRNEMRKARKRWTECAITDKIELLPESQGPLSTNPTTGYRGGMAGVLFKYLGLGLVG